MRLWTAGLILLCVACASPASAALLGDVDGDSRVTASDAMRLLHVVIEIRPSTSRERLLGDLWPVRDSGQVIGKTWWAGDGKLTLEDAVETLRSAVALSPVRDVGPMVISVAGSGPTSLQSPSTTERKKPALARDGPAEQIYLFDPYDVAIAPNGTVYFTEQVGNRIRVLDTNGTVRTLAGSLVTGFQDGKGFNARFNRPEGLALLPDGSVVVADTFNHAIRKISPNGNVVTIGGNGRPGYRDGKGEETLFYFPNGVGADPAGNIYIADSSNNAIRWIRPDGAVETLIGSSGEPGFEDGKNGGGKLDYPTGVSFDPQDGSLYIADLSNNAIRKLTPKGELMTVAGGTKGETDGVGRAARFNGPYGVDVDPHGRVWIADWFNGLIRVLHPEGRVETVAGKSPTGGFVEGPPSLSRFHGLMYVRHAPDGSIYLADTDNERIRVLIP